MLEISPAGVAELPAGLEDVSGYPRLLDALADTHQTATVSIGQSAESWEQVVARRFMRRSA